jgi:hypothetical protein
MSTMVGSWIFVFCPFAARLMEIVQDSSIIFHKLKRKKLEATACFGYQISITTVAARSKILDRSNTRIVGSNLIPGIDVCEGRGLAEVNQSPPCDDKIQVQKLCIARRTQDPAFRINGDFYRS